MYPPEPPDAVTLKLTDWPTSVDTSLEEGVVTVGSA